MFLKLINTIIYFHKSTNSNNAQCNVNELYCLEKFVHESAKKARNALMKLFAINKLRAKLGVVILSGERNLVINFKPLLYRLNNFQDVIEI
jgi:hypothetical protein